MAAMLYLGWMYLSSGPYVADKWLDGYVIELVLSMDAWLNKDPDGINFKNVLKHTEQIYHYHYIWNITTT